MVSKLHELSLIHAFALRTNYGQNTSYKTTETDNLSTKSIVVHVKFLELLHPNRFLWNSLSVELDLKHVTRN